MLLLSNKKQCTKCSTSSNVWQAKKADFSFVPSFPVFSTFDDKEQTLARSSLQNALLIYYNAVKSKTEKNEQNCIKKNPQVILELGTYTVMCYRNISHMMCTILALKWWSEVGCTLYMHNVEVCRHLRSASTSTPIVPSTCRSTLGNCAFPVVAAYTWNILPSSAKATMIRCDKTTLFEANAWHWYRGVIYQFCKMTVQHFNVNLN